LARASARRHRGVRDGRRAGRDQQEPHPRAFLSESGFRRVFDPHGRAARSARPSACRRRRAPAAGFFAVAAVSSAGNYVALISWVYLITNTVRVFFYAPQIRAVFKANDGASAVSIMTWGFWTFANFTAALY